MAISFEDSLKKNSANNTIPMTISLEDNGMATMSLDNVNDDNYSVMALAEDSTIVAYANDGNWQRHTDYTYYSSFHDDNISSINDEKNISLNSKQINITQEENSQYIPFEMSRFYDGYDLVTTLISIHYETKTGRHGANKAINVFFNDEKIRFGWLVDAGATVDVGTLKFEIHAYGTVIGSDGEQKAYVWKTKYNDRLNVLQSLCDCEDVINNIDDSWLQELVTDIAKEVADEIKNVSVGTQVEAAENAANSAKQYAEEAKLYAANASTVATNTVNAVLKDYATINYVDDAIARVDVSEQLKSYVKTEDLTESYYNKTETEQRLNTVLENYATKDDVSDAISSADLDSYYKKDETYSKTEVDEKVANVKVDLTGYATETYVDNKTSILSGNIEANTSSVAALNSAITKINQTLESVDNSPNAYYVTTYNEPYTVEGTEYTGENTLVLYKTDETDSDGSRTVVSAHVITGGGGGSTSTNTITINRVTPSPLVATSDSEIEIEYEFIGVDGSGEDIGLGYATWKVGTKTVINKKSIKTGVRKENLTDYIGIGSDQRITLIISDDIGTIQQKTWYVSVVDVKLSSNFHDTKYYDVNSPVEFTFTPYGAIDKTVHLLLDGEEIGTKSSPKSATGLLDSYSIPAQAHGSHLLEVYMTAIINGDTENPLESNHIMKDIIWYDSSSNVPVIGTVYQNFTVRQYDAVNIEYTVFDPTTSTPTVEIAVDGEVVSTPKLETAINVYTFKSDVVGEHTITITCGETVKTLKANITKLDINVTPVTTGLAFDFNPSGKSNITDKVWTDGAVSMTTSSNFDWVNGGYQYDKNGDQYFCVKSGTTATINYNLFADDAKTQGKEFKVVFKTTNIKKRDTTFVSCMNSGIGLDMKVQDANIYSSNGSLYSPYCEEDIIEFEFNINTIDNIPLVMTYEDGVGCRPMIYTSDSSFWQTNPQPIVIGSPDCDVHIYRMKTYTRSLSDSEILSNFILDARNADEMVKRYNRNQIYEDRDGVKVLTPESLAEACPDLRVIIVDAPWFTNDKGNKVDDTTITMIYKNGRPEDNWTCTGSRHSGQGTSSNEYGYAGRNIDLIMDRDTSMFKWVDENGDEIESKTITLTETSVPTDYLNVKLNIASSENQNNAQMARRYNTYNPFVRAAKFNDSKVKDCMEFYNCVIFVRENNPDISTHREFLDTETHFYGIGNVGDSKKTDDTRVNDKNDPRECIVEIKDYNVALAEFPTGNGDEICPPENWKAGNSAYDSLYAEYAYKDGEFDTFGSKSYEFRYEMKGITEEQREVNINAWRDLYRFVVTSTDDEFYNRLKEYFVVDSALYYYLFTERYTMVDNRAKNSFWHIGKVYITDEEAVTLGEAAGGFTIDNEQAAINDGYRWSLAFGYDFDTCLGIDNTGKLVLTYGKEDTDYYVDGDPSSSYIYRAAESTFFCRLRDLFASELQAMFVDRENANAWSANGLITQWDDAQNQFPEELWRLDIQRKYLRTYLGTSIDNSIAGAKEAIFLPQMMNGRKKYQRRMFERNQELYMATKYFGTVATQDQIRVRFNNPESYVLKPDFTLYLTPYSDMYIGVSFSATHRENFRAKAGIQYSIPYDSDTADITLIYGASFIQEIGDLSKCYIGDNDFTKATRLQSLVIGNDTAGYSNSYMKEIKLANNKLLEYLDVRNVTGLNSTIDLSQCGNMLELHAEGSTAKGVIFANGGKIQKFYLPSIASLTAKNLNYIEDFNIESYINLQTLVIENTPAIDTHEIVDTTLEVQSSLPDDSAKLSVLRLIGIGWNVDNTEILDDVILLRGQNADGGETTQSVLTGSVHVPVVKQQQLVDYANAWPNLDVVANTITPQYIVTFKNTDGTILRTYYVVEGSIFRDNKFIEKDTGIETLVDIVPTIPNTVSHDYTFAGWDTNVISVFDNLVITATYNESLRRYTIKYVSKGITMQESTGLYGENVPYTGITPVYTAEEAGYKYALFNRWDKSGFIDGDKVVTAIFDEVRRTPADFNGIELSTMTPVDIYALTKLNEQRLADFDIKNIITDKDQYSFTVGNDIDYDDINSELLISEKTHFNGTNHINFDGTNGRSNIQLFDVDKDFVLAIDYEFLSGNVNNAVLAQCFQANGSNGFKLAYNSGNANIIWGTTQETVVGANKREIIVIRHKKGDNNLIVYKSNLDGDNVVVSTLEKNKITSGTGTLVFGCAIADDGYDENYAIGNINWAKIWYRDLGDDVCRDLAAWTHESITLEVCGFRKYYLTENTSRRCSFSLLASHLLGRTKRWNSSNINIGGWNASELNRSLNTRLYNAIPNQIRALLKQVIVYSSAGNMSNELVPSNNYITIPAIIELDSSQNSEPYNSEGTSISYLSTNESRKRAFDGGDYNEYWTRSPNVGYANYIYHVDENGLSQGITNATSNLGVLIEISF